MTTTIHLTVLGTLFLFTLINQATSTFIIKGRQFAHVFGKRAERLPDYTSDPVDTVPYDYPQREVLPSDSGWRLRLHVLESLPQHYSDLSASKGRNSDQDPGVDMEPLNSVTGNNVNRLSFLERLEQLRDEYMDN